MTKINLRPRATEAFGWAAICDLHDHRCGRRASRQLSCQWIEPRRRGEFVGIERFAVGHWQAAMFVAVP